MVAAAFRIHLLFFLFRTRFKNMRLFIRFLKRFLKKVDKVET